MQVLAALFVLVPFCYLSGSFTINPVTEATSQARHLQLLSGCPPVVYWAGFYVSAVPEPTGIILPLLDQHLCVWLTYLHTLQSLSAAVLNRLLAAGRGLTLAMRQVNSSQSHSYFC